MTIRIVKLQSGGQTGADRAALDFAVAHNIPYGGYVPQGGWAEDFTEAPGILAEYPDLIETESSDPAIRTKLNVEESDATLVVRIGSMNSPGTDLTESHARELGRPLYVYTAGSPDGVIAWLDKLSGELVLNVAGQREGEAIGSYYHTNKLLHEIFTANL